MTLDEAIQLLKQSDSSLEFAGTAWETPNVFFIATKYANQISKPKSNKFGLISDLTLDNLFSVNKLSRKVESRNGVELAIAISRGAKEVI